MQYRLAGGRPCLELNPSLGGRPPLSGVVGKSVRTRVMGKESLQLSACKGAEAPGCRWGLPCVTPLRVGDRLVTGCLVTSLTPRPFARSLRFDFLPSFPHFRILPRDQ